MINILSEPAEIVFSRNPVWFKFHTDSLYATAGQAGRFLISFPTGPLIAGNNFDLNYSLSNQNFLVADVPDNSGVQLRSGAGLTLLQWCAQVIEDLLKNYSISNDFTLTVDLTGVNPRILFVAKKSDTAYDISLNVQDFVSIEQTLASIKEVRQPNFRLIFELFVQDAEHANFIKAGEAQYLDVNEDGQAWYNLSKTLTQVLIADGFDAQNPDTPAIQRDGKSCRQYYIRYAEYYGTSPSAKKVTDTSIKWAVLGGVGKVAGSVDLLAEYISDAKLKFLKQQALDISVKQNQPEWLSIIYLLAPPAIVRLRCDITYSDATTATFTAYPLADVSKFDKITYPSGCTQLGVHQVQPAKVVTKYSIYLEDGAAVQLTEKRTYWLDYRVQLYIRYCIELSSLGAYDTVVTYGKGSTEYSYISELAEIPRSIDFVFQKGETFEFDANITEKVSVASGVVTRRELLRFRDFFLSWDKYLIKDNKLIPILLSSKAIRERKDGNNRYALEFEFATRYAEELYSEEVEEIISPLGDLSQYLPPAAIVDPVNYDDRYYLKANTYNKLEADAFYNAILALEALHHNAQQAQIDGFVASLNGKSDTNHTHADLVPYVEYNAFADAVGIALIQKGAWDPAYTVDPLDPGVLPGYSIDNLVDHDLKQWRSLADENTSEPGTDPLKWVLVLNDISDAETATDRTWSSQKIVDTHYNKTQSDLRYSALSHTHIIANVTGLQAELDGKAALSHTHVIANVTGLQAALDAKAALVHTHIIADITGLQSALDAKEALANKNIANGYAGLDGAGLIPSSLLPSYVDDVLEYANFAALPATGVSSKIYVTLDTNKTYRWSGSAYPEISASPGSTDAVPEGSVNLYHTSARVQAIGDARYPLFNGTGATGTWGINISGNAATATLAANSTLWGGVAYGGPYLPLAGGILTGALIGTSATFTVADAAQGFKVIGTTGRFSVYPYLDATHGVLINSYNSGENEYKPMSFQASTYAFLQGNVGIGTTTPTGLGGKVLEVSIASAYPEIILTRTGSGARQWGTLVANAGQWLLRDYTSGNNTIIVQAGAPDTSLAILATSGNVGIGTVTPWTKLTVGDLSGTSQSIAVSSYGHVTGYLTANSGNYLELASDAGGLRFSVTGAGGASKYTIDASGNNTWTGTGTFGGSVQAGSELRSTVPDGGSTPGLRLIGDTGRFVIFPYFDATNGVLINSYNTSESGYKPMGFQASAYYFLQGNATFSGTVTASGGFFNSDERWKTFNNKTFNLDELQGESFKWNPFSGKDDGKNHYGYRAQYVVKYMPDAVQYDDKGFMSVNYTEVLVAKVQKLEEEVKLLKAKLYN